MQFDQYQALALKTESKPTSLQIDQVAFLAGLDIFISVTKVADLMKRKLFYGQDIPKADLLSHLTFMNGMVNYLGAAAKNDTTGAINLPTPQADLALDQLPEDMRGVNLNNLNIRLLHAALGIFTESGEQLEALREQYLGRGLDMTNFAEEVGDVNWYDAVVKDELSKLTSGSSAQINDHTIRLSNINKLQGNSKLKGRYSTGDFDVMDALNRNLAAERTLLESSDDSAAVVDTKVA